MVELAQMFNEIIGEMGFPICMVVYFIWDKTKITNQLTEAINNNNTILARLLERLEVMGIVNE